MTGLRTWTPGVSLRKESTTARRRIDPSKRERDFELVAMSRSSRYDLAATIMRCSTIGPSASAGMNVSAPTSTTTPIRSATKSGV